MIRRPPRSTLFPTRRSSDLVATLSFPLELPAAFSRQVHRRSGEALAGYLSRKSRSEEHTSELQSPCNLVCRLLLEKKKIVSCIFVVYHKVRLCVVICRHSMS